MAEIRPFRAWRYADRVPIDRVVTQPYDKISPAMRERYLKGHPHNLVRILLPVSESPSPEASPYEQAGETFRRWRREGIIEQIARPALFGYFQRFKVPDSEQVRTRKGFICLTRLEDYANKVVFPHERTLSGPKKDRLELLRHTRTHFGQIFFLYSDPECRIDGWLDWEATAGAEVSVRDEYGVDHTLWSISDLDMFGAFQRAMRDRKLIIADGHHRYETALVFRDEQRRALASSDAGDAEWVMATLVNMESPGLTILPTHRVLSGLESFDPARLLERARAYFHVRKVGGPRELEDLLHAGISGPARIGVGLKDQLVLLELRDGPGVRELMPEVGPRQAGLDVVILHRLVLERCLGISEDEVVGGRYLRYVRGFAEALHAAGAECAQACFLLNPTRIDQVRDIALGGEVLPQKSTDFFPKLLSGLTMYSVDKDVAK